MRISTKNMQAKDINVKRGPTTGNGGTGTKRADFMSEKAKSGSEKSELADMISGAVAARGRGMQGFGEACLYTGAAAWAVGGSCRVCGRCCSDSCAVWLGTEFD
jgi:hypothetical protein